MSEAVVNILKAITRVFTRFIFSVALVLLLVVLLPTPFEWGISRVIGVITGISLYHFVFEFDVIDWAFNR